MQVHGRFVEHFKAIAARHPGWIKGPFGIGGMIAFAPLDGPEETAKKVLRALFDNGVIAFYNGSGPTRIRVLPPVPVVTDAHIDAVCGIIEATLGQVAGSGKGA